MQLCMEINKTVKYEIAIDFLGGKTSLIKQSLYLPSNYTL